MLQKLKDLPYGIEGISAVGQVTKEDYEQVFEPILDNARSNGRRVRFLYEFGPEFEGFTAGGAWEEVKVGLSSMKSFEGCAVVSDVKWIREATLPIAFLLPCPLRVFSNEQRGEASDWLQSLPAGSSVAHRILPESGVLVVEVKQPLHAFDLDPLLLAVDTWLESEGPLRSLVLRVRDFPGWEKVAHFFRHLRFRHDHHLRLTRVALASDVKLTSLAQPLVRHFSSAELGTFDYDAVVAAVAWAGAPGPPAASTASAL